MNKIGIYKITNKTNEHCYVGQSRDIFKRWSDHTTAAFNPNDKSYEYPLYRAMRKYGKENFIFEILEECLIEQLNEKEHFWIKKLSPTYNQTEGGDYQVIPQKLTYEKVKEIQNILIQDIQGEISHQELANKYGVSKDTIRDINVGRTWKTDGLTYPLHYSKFDAYNPNKKKYFCCDCGVEISKGAMRCLSCENKRRKQDKPVSREELKMLIKTTSFLQIGRIFGVSDNTIRKWCDSYNLPKTKKEINSYSNEEWEKI